MKDSLWYEVEQVQPMQRHLLLILLIYRLCCVLEFLLRRKSPVFVPLKWFFSCFCVHLLDWKCFLFSCLCGNSFLLTPFLWSPAWSTSWQTPTCRTGCHAALSHPDLRQRSRPEKPSDDLRSRRRRVMVSLSQWGGLTEETHLYGLVNFVRRHGGRHGDGHGRGHRELTRSSPRLSRSVQRQRQEVRGGDGVDALSREGAGAAEHSAELPAWHMEQRDQEANHRWYQMNYVG